MNVAIDILKRYNLVTECQNSLLWLLEFHPVFRLNDIVKTLGYLARVERNDSEETARKFSRMINSRSFHLAYLVSIDGIVVSAA